MAGSERGKDAVPSSGHQLAQYEDDDDNDDKANPHSVHTASVSTKFRRSLGQSTSGSHSHLGNQAGMETSEDVAERGRADEGGRGYQEDIHDGAQEHVYMETHMGEEMVAHHQPHAGADGSDLASEAMRVFCSYDGSPAVQGHAEDTPGGVGNDYSEEDLQERGLEEAALEERVHGDQSPGYIPEDAERGGEDSSFSSMQQLQLRAQILVYGDLIKGVLPDETLMSSAFSNGSEGTEQESDRSPSGWNWEGPWQLAVEKEAERREAERLADEERINNKGEVVMTEGDVVNANLEPGTPSASPVRVGEDPTREVVSAAMAQAGGPADLSVTGLDEHAGDVSGVPSGLGLNLDTMVDKIIATTVNSIDISLLKDSTVETQVTRSPSLDPWLNSHTSPVPSMPGSLAWQTPVQAANVGQAATANAPSVIGGVVSDVPSTLTGNAEVLEEGSRKRKGRGREREKKTPAPKRTTPAPRRSRAKTASAAKTATPATLPTGAVPPRLVYESSEAAVIVEGGSPANLRTGDRMEAQGRSDLHAETQNWLEQAKASFEEAVSAANSAAEQVQLGKSVTTTPKLASAAAAVNAAASVAKAAAEAAKVAYEAALQAAMMVSDSIDTGSGRTSIGNGQGDKDGGLGGRRSAIAAAKEEARKRATGATPSMKPTPQTTDAVLRAARLMAEAASQAGAVLAKGNSGVSLTSPVSPVSKLDLNKIERKGRQKKENATIKSPEPIKPIETDPLKNVKGSMKKGARKRGKELQELNASNTPVQQGNDRQAKSGGKSMDQVVSSPSTEVPEIIEQAHIVEGSVVEVMNDEEGLRGGWFSAKVLQLKPGEAYVQFDEILTDDGTTQLKDWFPLQGPLEGTEPGRPRIRLISPNNIAREEGRRKRRRTTTSQKVVALGDRVEAFVQDGWWEGIVKVVDEDDDSKITVHFPGEGDTSTVKSWNLRPSFMWKDGRWEQWTRGSAGQTKLDDGLQSKKEKVTESPKVEARKSGRGKSIPAGKVSDEATESARASRRAKPTDSQSGTPVAPPILTRSSPRQKIPPKRKEGPTEVSTPTQAPTPVTTRTRSFAADAVTQVQEPLKRSAPSGIMSPRSSDVKKSESQSKELDLPRKSSKDSDPTPSHEKKTAATRLQAKDVAKPATRRSARL